MLTSFSSVHLPPQMYIALQHAASWPATSEQQAAVPEIQDPHYCCALKLKASGTWGKVSSFLPPQLKMCMQKLCSFTYSKCKVTPCRSCMRGPNSRGRGKHRFFNRLEVKAETQKKLIFAICSNSHEKWLSIMSLVWLRSCSWLPWEVKTLSCPEAFHNFDHNQWSFIGSF